MIKKYFFTASWCPNCQIVKPIIKELKDVEIIDAEQRQDLVDKFSIMSLPVYIVVDGDDFDAMSGAKPRKIIEDFYNINKIGGNKNVKL